MSRRANPVTIGLFVVGAVVLLIGSLAFLGASKLMKENPRFVVFFDESVNGLDVGAWIKFKGVPIGRVDEIRIRMPSQKASSDGIPVIVELYDEKIVNKLGAPFVTRDAKVLADHVENGLRARLNTESLITGLLFVELDFVEDAPVADYHQDPMEILEIPTIPSQLEEITRNATEAVAKVGDIDFAELNNGIQRLLDNVNQKIEDVDTKQLSLRMNAILADVEAILDDGKILKVVEDLDATIVSVKALAVTIEAALPGIFEQVDQAFGSLDVTFDKASSTFDAASATLETVNETVSTDSPLYRELVSTVDQAQATLKAINDLVVFIENNPQALIKGRTDD